MGRWPLPIGILVTSSGAWPVSCVGCGDGSNTFIPTAPRYDWDGVLGAGIRFCAGLATRTAAVLSVAALSQEFPAG